MTSQTPKTKGIVFYDSQTDFKKYEGKWGGRFLKIISVTFLATVEKRSSDVWEGVAGQKSTQKSRGK